MKKQTSHLCPICDVPLLTEVLMGHSLAPWENRLACSGCGFEAREIVFLSSMADQWAEQITEPYT